MFTLHQPNFVLFFLSITDNRAQLLNQIYIYQKNLLLLETDLFKKLIWTLMQSLIQNCISWFESWDKSPQELLFSRYNVIKSLSGRRKDFDRNSSVLLSVLNSQSQWLFKMIWISTFSTFLSIALYHIVSRIRRRNREKLNNSLVAHYHTQWHTRYILLSKRIDKSKWNISDQISFSSCWLQWQCVIICLSPNQTTQITVVGCCPPFYISFLLYYYFDAI